MGHARRDVPLWLAGSILTIAALPLAVVAQNALDMNLQVGSGGYNRPVRTSTLMPATRYVPGNSKPQYVVGMRGDLVYSPNNAFFPQSRYTATGYTATYQSPGWSRQFRYQDQY